MNKKVTFNKRKKGLIKKAMELSVLCDTKVFVCIADSENKNKLTIYSSNGDSIDTLRKNLNSKEIEKEYFETSQVNKIN